MPEEHGSSPVVAVTHLVQARIYSSSRVLPEVLSEGTSRASSHITRIFVHSRIERIASDDLMHMCGGQFARLDKGIKALNAQSRASKA